MTYVRPGQPGSPVTVEERYDNFIGGKWLPPAGGQYMPNPAPATGEVFTEVARSTAEDVEAALDAAHVAAIEWNRTTGTERARVLEKIADAIEANQEMLAVAESWENGKPVRETLNADIPLAVDHFRYFAAAARSREGRLTVIDEKTTAYHFQEPLGVVAQIIPFNFPILMAAWKLAPALAAGNCSVIKPASPTPWSILKLAEVIEDVVPPGVINIVTGPGAEVGKALATSPRIAKIGFTGETVTGRLMMQYASQNIIPVTLELGGKSPNVFFEDVMAHDDAFLDKAVEGLVLYAFNKGEVCTCPSRALIQESIYDEFMERCLQRIGAIVQGNPLDPATMLGPQVSQQQLDEDLRVRRHRPRGGRRGPDRWQARRDPRRVRQRLVLRADRAQGPQQDAGLPGGDLRTRAGGHHLPGRGRGTLHRQRLALRAGRRSVDPRHQPDVADEPCHPGGSRLGQLLPPVPGRSGLRRVQDLGDRP